MEPLLAASDVILRIIREFRGDRALTRVRLTEAAPFLASQFELSHKHVLALIEGAIMLDEGGHLTDAQSHEAPGNGVVRDLKIAEVCYILSFLDEEMRVPDFQPYVYIGQDLEDGDAGIRYYQDSNSFRECKPWNSEEAIVITESTSGNAIFINHAEALARCVACSLRETLVRPAAQVVELATGDGVEIVKVASLLDVSSLKISPHLTVEYFLMSISAI